jgi:hypothetical protein
MSPAEPMCGPPPLPCWVCSAPWSHDVTGLVLSKDAPIFRSVRPNGFRGDCGYPMAAVHPHAGK